MSAFQEIHDRNAAAEQKWAEEFNRIGEEAQKRLQEAIALKDTQLAKSAGMTLQDFQALMESEGRIVASCMANIMKHSLELGRPISLEAARKSYELLYPDTSRKDTGV